MIQQISNACRLLTGDGAGQFPLLWNTVFIPDRDFMELRSEFRYASAVKQRNFIVSRFTHDVSGLALNPYEEYPVVASGESGTAQNDRKCLAYLLLTNATAVTHQGKEVRLFSKIQLPAARPGIWSLQGTRETAGLARAWIDKKLLPIIKLLFKHEKNSRRPEAVGTVQRIHGRRSVSVNDPTEAYLRQAQAVVTPDKGSSGNSYRVLQGATGAKAHPKKGIVSYADVVAENQKAPPLISATLLPPRSIMTTANLTESISPMSKGQSLEEMQLKIDKLVKTVETLTTQQQVTQEKYEAQRQADQMEFKRMLDECEFKDDKRGRQERSPSSPPEEWVAEIEARIIERIAEADKRWMEQTKTITQQSQSAVIDFTSSKLLEMSTKVETLTQHISQLPTIMHEMRQFMETYSSPGDPSPGKRVRHNESYGPGSRVECQYSVDFSGTGSTSQVDSRDVGDPGAGRKHE